MVLAVVAASSTAMFAANTVDRLESRRMNMHCSISGESIRKVSQKDAIHDQSERQWLSDAPFGIWSNTVDFELEANSSRVVMKWNGSTIEARRLYPFRPSRIRAKTTEGDVTWKWLFRFQFLSRISDRFIDRVEGQVDASKKSAKDSRADVHFHGGGDCYVFRKCEAGSVLIDCPDKNLCLDRERQCGQSSIGNSN